MNAGLQLRMSRLFNADTGKSVIIAVDHGIEGVPKGLENPTAKVKALIELGVDALLINPGGYSNEYVGFGSAGMLLESYWLLITSWGDDCSRQKSRK